MSTYAYASTATGTGTAFRPSTSNPLVAAGLAAGSGTAWAPHTPPFPGLVQTAVLLVDGADVTGATEWSMTWEERADGSPGTFSAVVQNRSPSDYLIGVNQRDHVSLALSPSGFPLYDGEVTTSLLDLPVGQIGRWKLQGTDWNTIPDLRLVGVPNGTMWLSTDGGATFQAVDPLAQNSADDASTVARLFGGYAIRPPGVAFNTSAYVTSYVPNNVLNDPLTGQPLLQWSHTTLRSALDDLRSLGSAPIYAWIDPAGFVHWKQQADMTGPAPADITDDHPDGVSTIGCRALSFGFDGTYMPQQVWVNGTTDCIYNGGLSVAQGTGWGDGPFASADPAKRQISVDARSVNVTQREAVGAAYTQYNDRARVKISVTIGGRLDEGPVIDGWRCGQLVKITDARLPSSLNGQSWPIMRVQGSLRTGQPTTRIYTLECGDAPLGRFYASYRSGPKTLTAPKLPAYTWEIYFQNTSPGLGNTQTLVLQLMDSSKKAVRAQAIPGNLTLTVTKAGSPVTSDAVLTPLSVTSNADGQAAVSFTTDSTQDGLTYTVECATPPQ